MVVVRFRNSSEHRDLLKKIKKMREFTEDIEECLENAMEDEVEYRNYRKDWEEDEEESSHGGRYAYSRMSKRNSR